MAIHPYRRTRLKEYPPEIRAKMSLDLRNQLQYFRKSIPIELWRLVLIYVRHFFEDLEISEEKISECKEKIPEVIELLNCEIDEIPIRWSAASKDFSSEKEIVLEKISAFRYDCCK
jgi:hypothetical protein